MRASKDKPYGLDWRSRKSFIVSTVGVALFTDLFLYGLVVPALPFILADRFDLSPDQIQGHVSNLLTAYAGASVAASPIAGVITDRLGSRRVPFLVGVASLFGATLLLLVGRTIPVLLVARVLQGISAAIVWATGMALLLETVGPENLGKSIGTIFGFITFGTLAAPITGGILYEKGGNAALFGVALSLLAIDFIMRLLVIEVKAARRYQPPVESTTDVGDTPPNDSQRRIATEEQDHGVCESSPLLQDQNKAEDPYKLPSSLPRIVHAIPILSCLRNPRLIAALLIALAQGVLVGSIDATVPMVSQENYGFTSLQAGLMFLPIGIANLIFGPILGWCVDRFGTKRIAVLVYAYLVPVLISFRLARPGGIAAIAGYASLLALAGIGLAGMGAPALVEAGTVVHMYHQANPEFYGELGPYAQLYSLSNIAFSLGLAVGPPLGGGLRQAIGYGNMNAVLAGICAVTAIVCYFSLGNKPRTSETSDQNGI
uniref:MFS membrane transportor n=1 Tax=Nodulisporium sp. TaxID=1897413 RepID=A0A2R4QEY4_9PEZI|nr:MFS membrane transportor [Nodulisporium sp.]